MAGLLSVMIQSELLVQAHIVNVRAFNNLASKDAGVGDRAERRSPCDAGEISVEQVVVVRNKPELRTRGSDEDVGSREAFLSHKRA